MKIFIPLVFLSCAVVAAVRDAAPDVMREPELRNVRLLGRPAEKMNAFFRERMLSRHAQKEIFGEARSAFRDRNDDERSVDGKMGVGGLWRGEFWGKLMLSTARVADYLQDPALLTFVKEECHRMIQLQDADGYLGSYASRENVSIPAADRPGMRQTYGWNTVWNLWNRKYCIWAMLMAYKVTGDPEILESAVAQMTQWIDMMHRLNMPLYLTGQPEKVGLPSMSVLKPLLMLYRETDDIKYLAYAKEMLADWDRADGACPNFFRNADREDPLYTWYPNPQSWGKSYEMMSCLDGLLEYWRLGADRRALDTVIQLRENLVRSELNVLGDVGYVDQFYGAAEEPNAATEICDTIHWIRLNYDLYLITGEDEYMDAVEFAYFNAFLAGVFRDGTWGAFTVRDAVRHDHDRQCGYAYNHCCVNNIPRTFMDMAAGTVTVDRKHVFHVNFYQDAKVELDGVTFEISGNYPVGDSVFVRTSEPVNVQFRKPGWCPSLRIARPTDTLYVLMFDMAPRIIERATRMKPVDVRDWHYTRYMCRWQSPSDELRVSYRSEPAATVMWGPLVLAKSARLGATRAELLNRRSINGKGCTVVLTPVETEDDDVWCAWDVRILKNGIEQIHTRACDYQSAGDDPYGPGAARFSVWF